MGKEKARDISRSSTLRFTKLTRFKAAEMEAALHDRDDCKMFVPQTEETLKTVENLPCVVAEAARDDGGHHVTGLPKELLAVPEIDLLRTTLCNEAI
jgi:hypothetical protein